MFVKYLAKPHLESRHCIAVAVGRSEYGVADGTTNFTINFNSSHCDCQLWHLSGLPSKHVARCILRERKDFALFVHKAYKIENYKQPYNLIMRPIPCLIFWPQRNCPLLGSPEVVNKGRGCPKTSRKKDTIEIGYARSST